MGMSIRPIDITVILATLAALVFTWTRSRKGVGKYSNHPLPPGPKGLPIIGNLLDMPSEKEWLTFAEWGRKYGPICHINVFGRQIFILNTYEAMVELLEKRSVNYSERPHSLMLYDEMHWDWLTTFVEYGPKLQLHRSLMQKYFQPNVLKNYYTVQTQMTHKMLGHLLESPEKFMHHIRTLSGAVIMKIVYGYELKSENDAFVKLADEALRWLSKSAVPGNYWIDFIPFMRHTPDWILKMSWREEGKIGYELAQKMVYMPFNMTKANIARGSAMPCVMAEILEDRTSEEGKIRDEGLIAGALGTMYTGGADTTVSAMQSVVLALLRDPRIMNRAQEEIDRVVGNARLPTFEDRPSLPYIEGIVREANRWNPVTPTGVNHANTNEDIYLGYRIPAGSTILANQWAVLHDPSLFPDPFEFKPERWLDAEGNLLVDSKVPIPTKSAFGFGRRICPGRYMAENTIYIGVVNMLAVFNIEKARNEKGELSNPPENYSSGLISYPYAFECSFKPRSLAAEALVKQAAANA